MEPDKKENSNGSNSHQSGPNLMLLGTACVIGAVTAHVFGFRYSRWAVGKDIHRAWERYNLNKGSSGQRSSFNSTSNGSQSSSTYSGRTTESNQSNSQHSQSVGSRSNQSHGYSRTSKNSPGQDRMNSDRFYEGGSSKRQQEGYSFKDNKSNSRMRYESFQVEIDPEMIEKLFRSMPRGSRGQMGGLPGIGFDPRIIEELLKATGASRSSFKSNRKSSAGTSNPFEFWEDVFRSSNSSGGADSANDQNYGFGGNRPFGFGDFGDRQRAYSTLGIKEGASTTEIKQAYRREVLRWHPDKYQGDDREGAARKFREATSAYEVLTKGHA